MTHDALVIVAATSHAALLVGALAAFYKYWDRTDVMGRSLQGTENALRVLRREIASDLGDALKEELSGGATITSIIVDPNTASYAERPADLFDGEAYREVVRDFIEVDSERVADCRSLRVYRDSWSRRAKRLSWGLLLLAAYEALVAGLLAFVDRTNVLHFPDALIQWAALPTGLVGGFLIVTAVLLGKVHDRITDIRMKYEAL